MRISIPKEIRPGENRVAMSPQAVKKLAKKGVEVAVEKGAGLGAGFSDSDFSSQGASLIDGNEAFRGEIVFKVHPPSPEEIGKLKAGSLLFTHAEPYRADNTLAALAKAGIDCVAMELIPRTSRAQSMDSLSSQANIAGYRAVLEAAIRYPRFMPMMMTSAGMSKPAKLAVLGVGVAGLQAIATARRLGAAVEAYDVRPEVKEQILSLGAKFIEIDIGESGSGQGGYAKELSPEAKAKLDAALQEKLSKFDILITTANIPGRKAPVLVTEKTVTGMRTGSVIIDMAAANGGNCPLTEANKIVEKFGVTIVGHTNYPSMLPGDSSSYYANNLVNLLELFLDKKDSGVALKFDLNDDIVAAALATRSGELRWKPKA